MDDRILIGAISGTLAIALIAAIFTAFYRAITTPPENVGYRADEPVTYVGDDTQTN